MISAILLVPNGGEEPERASELAVRSLAWLVPAVVAGVVRDVVAACPTHWAVVDIMDHAGCTLVQAEGEGDRLAAALAAARCARALVVMIGYHPDGPLVAEIDVREGSAVRPMPAALRQAPNGLVQRIFPGLAPVVGVIVDRERSRSMPVTFATLAREAREGKPLRSRMVPVM